MSQSLEALERAAMHLPPEDRIRLAQRLIVSVERDVQVKDAWDAEIERRVAAVEASEVSSASARTVLEEVRALLSR